MDIIFEEEAQKQSLLPTSNITIKEVKSPLD